MFRFIHICALLIVIVFFCKDEYFYLFKYGIVILTNAQAFAMIRTDENSPKLTIILKFQKFLCIF